MKSTYSEKGDLVQSFCGHMLLMSSTSRNLSLALILVLSTTTKLKELDGTTEDDLVVKTKAIVSRMIRNVYRPDPTGCAVKYKWRRRIKGQLANTGKWLSKWSVWNEIDLHRCRENVSSGINGILENVAIYYFQPNGHALLCNTPVEVIQDSAFQNGMVWYSRV